MKVSCVSVIVCGLFLTLTSTSLAVKFYCVTPTPQLKLKPDHEAASLHGHMLSQCTENNTWNGYLAKQEEYVINKTNVTFLFFNGLHFMNRSLEARNVTNLHFKGNSIENTILSSNLELSTPFLISNFSNTVIEGLTINTCASLYDDITVTGTIFFSSGNNVSVKHIEFNNNCNGSYIAADNVENIAITSVVMQNNGKLNKTCGNICFYDNVSGIIELHMLTFLVFHDSDDKPQFSSINFGPNPVDSAQISIDRCHFSCRRPLLINVGNATITLNNITAIGCHSNSLPAFFIRVVSGRCIIQNSFVMGYNYAIVVYTFNTSYLEVRDSSFHSNTVTNERH